MSATRRRALLNWSLGACGPVTTRQVVHGSGLYEDSPAGHQLARWDLLRLLAIGAVRLIRPPSGPVWQAVESSPAPLKKETPVGTGPDRPGGVVDGRHRPSRPTVGSGDRRGKPAYQGADR